MNLFTAIEQRRSYRGDFEDQQISKNHLDRLLESARWSPSPFNVQPWKLLIIESSDGKNAIADLATTCIADQFKDQKFLDGIGKWMRSTEKEWRSKGDGVLLSDQVSLPTVIAEHAEKLDPLIKNAKHFTILGHLGVGKIPAREMADQIRKSPMLMIVFMDGDRRSPGEGGSRWMWLGMGAMLQNLLLTATALKIGVQFVSAPIERQRDRDQLSKIFNAPDHLEIITILRLGYARDRDLFSVRLSPSDFVIRERFE